MKITKFLILIPIFLIFSLSIGSICYSNSAINNNKNHIPNQNTIVLKKWFKAWELVSKKIYKFKKNQTPLEFVFFDENHVYSTSIITIPNGDFFEGPNFLNEKLNWKKEIHNGKIILPNNQEVPIGMMCFASTLNEKGDKSFFVMPLFNFWQKAEVESKEISLENLTTGIFLHEFSHTQQMRNFGKRVTQIEAKYKFDFNFSDSIIQDYFKNNQFTMLNLKMKSSYFMNQHLALMMLI